MTQVDGVRTAWAAGATGSSGSSGTTGSTGSTGSTGRRDAGLGDNALDQQMFLKLLVAQLKYQDPTNPADATKFLTETAQFAVVEKLEALSALDRQVLDATRSQAAVSLVGRAVTYTDASGTSRTGTVTAASVGVPNPSVTIDGLQVALDAVTGVSQAAPAAATT